MQRKFVFAIDEYYHLYNRGTDRRQIFLDRGDYLRFLSLLYLANKQKVVHLSELKEEGRSFWSEDWGESLVNIGAYCLMSNHFHLLVREKIPGGISLFMKKLLTGYSMYFNKKNQRIGQLFEGRFRATHADRDEYLKYLFAYIHLNPVKITDPTNWERKIIPDPIKALEFLHHYHYSSFLDYLTRPRAERAIINPVAFPEYFSAPKDFTGYIRDWTEYDDGGN